MEELISSFRLEFLDRLDEIIMFKPLGKNDIAGIIDLIMKNLNKRLADKELTVELTDAARENILENAYDPAFGARPLKRYIQKWVETLSAKLILEGNLKEGDVILMDVKDNELYASVK